MFKRVGQTALVLTLCGFLGACGPLIASYSLEAYKNATSLKAEVLDLIGKSDEEFSNHRKDVDAITVKIDTAYEFAAGMPYNGIVTAEWELLRDPKGGLYGGFIKVWRKERAVSIGYRTEKKRQISDAFDYIICIEANKQAPKACDQPASTDATTVRLAKEVVHE